MSTHAGASDKSFSRKGDVHRKGPSTLPWMGLCQCEKCCRFSQLRPATGHLLIIRLIRLWAGATTSSSPLCVTQGRFAVRGAWELIFQEACFNRATHGESQRVLPRRLGIQIFPEPARNVCFLWTVVGMPLCSVARRLRAQRLDDALDLATLRLVLGPKPLEVVVRQRLGELAPQ